MEPLEIYINPKKTEAFVKKFKEILSQSNCIINVILTARGIPEKSQLRLKKLKQYNYAFHKKLEKNPLKVYKKMHFYILIQNFLLHELQSIALDKKLYKNAHDIFDTTISLNSDLHEQGIIFKFTARL